MRPLRLSRVLDGITVLVTPTTATSAPKGQSQTGDWSFNLPFSASGHPSMTVPCGFDRSGLPIGLQLVSCAWPRRPAVLAGAPVSSNTRTGIRNARLWNQLGTSLMKRSWIIGLDIGGTFTDVVMVHPTTRGIPSLQMPDDAGRSGARGAGRGRRHARGGGA